jgi:CheY-like chemotaxis protein
MLTNAFATQTATTRNGADGIRSSAATQKVVIVNGSAAVMDLLETVLEAGNYDMVFVESSAHAYSQIKRVQPDLVVLCVRIEDLDGFQVLSMLKLDDETKRIPVLTYTTEYEGQEREDDEDEADGEVFTPRLALRMN